MSDWPRVALADVVNRVTEKNAQGYDRVMTVAAGRGLVEQESFFSKRVASKDLSTYYVVQDGDFVYNKSTSATAAYGVVARYSGDAPGVVTPLYFAFRHASDKVLPDYLLLAANGQEFFQSLAGMLREGARSHGLLNVRVADFYGATVALPTLAEQRRIVEVMAAVDAQIDAQVAEVERADRLWWCLAAEMVAELADSEVVHLDAIADISGGLTKNKKDFGQPDLIDVPYLRVANVHRRYLDLRVIATIQTTAAKADALRLLPGDVLFNEGGDKDKLGRGAVWKGQIDGCIHQNHVFRARVTDRSFDPRFISAWGNTFGKAWFEKFGTQTTGIASINRGTLSRFPVPKVDREVQERWADELDAVVTTHDANQTELARTRDLRKVLLTSLLSQGIEIPESYDTVPATDVKAVS